jgi:predicted DNA-binding transcriptional regulator AlpA
MPDDVTTKAAPPALLIDIKVLSALLSRSVRSLERDRAAGRLPVPIRLGGSRLWRRAEIDAWVAAGCPDQVRWLEPRPDATR